jgi:exosortase C (VPDSG-CTERM-specific)
VQTPKTNDTPAPLAAATVPQPAPGAESNRTALRQGLTSLVLLAAGLGIGFALPLYDLLRFSLHSDLYSHICLVPFICGYVVWLRRSEWTDNRPPARGAALVFALIGLALVAGYWIARLTGWEPELQDRLSLLTLAFVILFVAGSAWLTGGHNLRLFAFPLAFLLFMVPFPLAVEEWIEALLQHASADASYALLRISGMPVFRIGTEFMLPGFSFEVAPECSGIHSTLVLFITSLLAGHFFFRYTWTRTVLAVGVLVLGVLRNAVRIFTLAQLCVRVDPKFIDSPLHHRGGLLFFIVSLIPFFLLIWLLRKLELRSKK